MKTFISGLKNVEYKKEILKHLIENGVDAEIVDFDICSNSSELGVQFGKFLNSNNDDLGIIINDNSIGAYNSINKTSTIVCAPVTDEHSSHMTRDHNGTRIIIIPTNIVAVELGKSIALNFSTKDYAGGRHQIRLDMMTQITNGGK